MKNWIVRRITSRAAWLLLVLPLTGGCASGLKKFEWTEDVKLSDGRMIVVQRTSEYRTVMDVGAGFQRGSLFDNASISADLPAPVSRKVEWRGQGISPIVLDIQADNSVYLICAVSTNVGADFWRVPDNEFYVVFSLTTDGWKRIPIAELPLSVNKPNLFVSGYDLFITRDQRPPAHVDLALKQEFDSRPSLSLSLKSIVRLTKP